jgi:hypothetical protein
MDGLGSHDYMQTVVLHKNSVTSKRRLKYTIIVNVILLLLMIFRLSTSFFVLLNIRPPQFLQLIRFPRPFLWEYFWLLSVISTSFGIAAIRRNRLLLLHQYLIGQLIFGVLPTVFGIFDLLDDLVRFFNTHETSKTLFGLPIVVLWSMFLAVSLQVQGFALYFAWNLRQAWKARLDLKKLK